MTLSRRPSAVLGWGARALAGAGVPCAVADARLLLCHTLDVEPGALVGAPDLDGDQVATYRRLVARRREGEPAQYLTGRAWFRHEELAVGPGVFIPRPETELVAQAAVDEARQVVSRRGSAVVVDLCTGSGAIALAVAHEVPEATVHAVELDPVACDWARRNLSGTGVVVHHGDACSLEVVPAGSCDVVVTNPPYLRSVDAPRLDPGVVGREPAMALFAGPEGLDVIEPLVRHAEGLLADGGLMVVEHDESHQDQVMALFGAQWTQVRGHDDLAGRPRHVTARRRVRQ